MPVAPPVITAVFPLSLIKTSQDHAYRKPPFFPERALDSMNNCSNSKQNNECRVGPEGGLVAEDAPLNRAELDGAIRVWSIGNEAPGELVRHSWGRISFLQVAG